MKEDSGSRGGKARGWPYIVAGVVFAAIIGWISYTDALFVTRLAGNTGGIAYAYPVIPDGLLFFSLLSAWEAARAGVPRSGWAVAGLALGAGMTLAANVGAGLGHSVLDAVIDGLVPVCFFIAVEIVLWHVRHARQAPALAVSAPVSVPAPVAAVPKVRELMRDYDCAQATAEKMQKAIRRSLQPYKSPPAGEPDRLPPAPAGAEVQFSSNGNGAHG